MKWLKRINKENKEIGLLIIAPIIVSFFSALVASAFIKGTPFFIFIIIALLIIIIYILSLTIVGKVLVDNMATALDTRLPSTQVVLANEDMAREEIVKVVNDAKVFIAATGSISRVTTYLNAIEQKLNQTDILYRRVLLGDKISKEMCQHLCRILTIPTLRNKTIICRHHRSDLGYFITTDAGWFAFMPSPLKGRPLENFIKISRDPRVIEYFRTYISEYLIGTADERIDSPERIRQLCESKTSNGKCLVCSEWKRGR